MISKQDVLDMLEESANDQFGDVPMFMRLDRYRVFIRLLQVLTERLPDEAFDDSEVDLEVAGGQE